MGPDDKSLYPCAEWPISKSQSECVCVRETETREADNEKNSCFYKKECHVCLGRNENISSQQSQVSHILSLIGFVITSPSCFRFQQRVFSRKGCGARMKHHGLPVLERRAAFLRSLKGGRVTE